MHAVASRASAFYAALGIYLVAGLAITVAGTLAFVELAVDVRAGSTQRFDVAVLQWMGAHQVLWIQRSVLEVTALGTGLVVLMLVAVASLFLALSGRRSMALLLLVATAGELVLNTVLKLGFDRPRPQIFAWGTHVVSSSFPSGHATSSVVVYSMIAYLAARLERRWWERWLTGIAAALVIVLVCLSRLYLGVHYPSDVAAGFVIGLAWSGFCVSGLEALQRYGARHGRRRPSPGREPEGDARHVGADAE